MRLFGRDRLKVRFAAQLLALSVLLTGMGTMAQSMEVTERKIQSHVEQLYPGKAPVLRWHMPVRYRLIGPDAASQEAKFIAAKMTEFARVTGLDIRPSGLADASDVNFILIFVDDPGALADDPGVRTLFYDPPAGVPGAQPAMTIEQFRAQLAGLREGGWLKRGFSSDSEVLYFAAIGSMALLRNPRATTSILRILFSGFSQAVSVSTEFPNSLVAVGDFDLDSLNQIDTALLAAMYADKGPPAPISRKRLASEMAAALRK